jgi:transposase-like protein
MTDETMNLRTLIEKTPDTDLLREMIGFAGERLMEMEVAGVTGAAYREKNPDRLVQRNGTATGFGRRAPAVSSCAFPKLRKGSYFHDGLRRVAEYLSSRREPGSSRRRFALAPKPK